MNTNATLLAMAILTMCAMTPGDQGRATEAELRTVASLLPEHGTFIPTCGTGLHEVFRPYNDARNLFMTRSGAGDLAVRHLKDQDKNVRYICMDILASLKPHGTEGDILAAVMDEKGDPIIRKGLRTLAMYRTSVAAECLLTFIDKQADRRYTTDELQALAIVRQQVVAPRAIKYLKTPELTIVVLYACATSGNRTVTPSIKEYLTEISDPAYTGPEGYEPNVWQWVRYKWQKAALLALWALQDRETFMFIAEMHSKLRINMFDAKTYSGENLDGYFTDHVPPTTLPSYILEFAGSRQYPHRDLANAYLQQASGAVPNEAALSRWEERYRKIGDNIIPLLLDCMSDPDQFVCRGSLQNLQSRRDFVSDDEASLIRAALKKYALSPGEKPNELLGCLYAYRDENVRQLFDHLSRNSNERLALDAVGYITVINEREGLVRLRHFLGSRDPDIAFLAAWTLASRHDDAGLAILFERARRDDMNYAINITEVICRCLNLDFDRNALIVDRKKTLDLLYKKWKP